MAGRPSSEAPEVSPRSPARGASRDGAPPTSGTVPIALGRMASEGPLTIPVRGTCMEPWLSDGDRVEVRRRRWYWPGDVVAFQDRRGRLVVHRLLGWRPARGGLRLLTQADAASRADSSVPRSHVVGRVQAPVPWNQRLRAVGRLVVLAAHLLGRRFGTRVPE
jgi:hypothetical protein